MGRSYKIPNWDGNCIVCGETFNVVKFTKGKAGTCNRCSKKEWEKNNSLKIRCQRLYGNAQKRAKQNGWPSPDFTSKWIEEKILNGHCEATGIAFDLETKTSDIHASNPWVPSIDRIDSSLPYIKSNVQIVVFMYNVCKGEFNHDDVISFCKETVRNLNYVK